jgi:serine/threonine protein kinase
LPLSPDRALLDALGNAIGASGNATSRTSGGASNVATLITTNVGTNRDGVRTGGQLPEELLILSAVSRWHSSAPRDAESFHEVTADSILSCIQDYSDVSVESPRSDPLDDHILGVLDSGNTPLSWIAMEHMDAGHLGEQAGDLPVDQSLWTAIAEVARHAHRRGVAHLDLKPENVLFRAVADAWDAPKVADWGLSKHLLEHSKSAEGVTPHYAAPEQFADGYGTPDDITDVYQLGAVFYELFTGRPPFEGRPMRVMRQVETEQPTPPSDLADVPEGLDDVLLTALATERDKRYDAVVLLRSDLQELFESV